jgi:diadenosine tetraphosphate (Ap4A) HIT family hydrolase
MIMIPYKIFCMEPQTISHQQPQKPILYAPWRGTYAQKMETTISQATEIAQPKTSCRLCDANKYNKEDLIVYRGKKNNIILASQPYIDKGAHLLIVPLDHTKELSDLSPETRNEKDRLTQQLCAYFSQDYYETCINANQGTSAGASVPDHYHQHVIINTSPPCYNLIQAIEQTKKGIDLSSLSKSLQRHLQSLANLPSPKICYLCTWQPDCYLCSITKNIIEDRKHLIIHRGEHSSIMLSHTPTYFGEIDIVPHKHFSALETMDQKTYDEMNHFTSLIYPILLKILNAQDSNIGLNSYGSKSSCSKHHIRQQIIPRKDKWIMSPIVGAAHPLSSNIMDLYRELCLEWGQRANL